MKYQELIKKIEDQAKTFKSRAVIGYSDMKRHDLIKPDEQKCMWIAHKQLGWSFIKVGSVFSRDRRTIKKAVEGYKIIEKTTPQKPYEDTPHKRKMKELAKALAEKISLPSIWDKDLWRDLPLEFQPGKYSLSICVVEIGKDDQIKVKYCDIRAGVAAPHLIKGLYTHLSTSGLPKFAGLMGDKGRLDNWVGAVEQYSEALTTFLKVITDEVKGYRAKVDFHDEVKPGLTKWFILTAWNDILKKASGYSWIDNSWYHPPELSTPSNLWPVKCGSYIIGIAKSKKTHKTYVNWHKKLRVNDAKHQSAKDIHAKSQTMSNVSQDIRQQLQEFSDMQRLPGHCELC